MLGLVAKEWVVDAYNRAKSDEGRSRTHEDDSIIETIAQVLAQEISKPDKHIGTLQAYPLIESFFFTHQESDAATKAKGLATLIATLKGALPIPDKLIRKGKTDKEYRNRAEYAVAEAFMGNPDFKEAYKGLLFTGSEPPILLNQLIDAVIAGRDKVSFEEAKQLIVRFLSDKKSFRDPRDFEPLRNALQGREPTQSRSH